MASRYAAGTGIVAFDDEFLAHLVTANNQTIGDTLRPGLDTALNTGHLPALLPGSTK